MGKALVLVSILAVFTVCSSSQTTTIEIQKAQDGTFLNRYIVAAANNDPLAVTPAQIFAANQALAKAGSTDAAWELGLAYMQGFGVEQNLALAEHWFEIGATNPDEKNIVGSMYEHGEYFLLNLEAAARWLRAAGRPLGNL